MFKTAILFILASLSLWSSNKVFAQDADYETVTRALSKFAIETKADDISLDAYDAAKRAIIDALGNAIAGYNATGMDSIVSMMKEWGGKPEATVWGYGIKLPSPTVAFVNSTMAHALDLDDLHKPSGTHISCVIIPVAFTVAETVKASGKELLEAIILGIEVATRLKTIYGQNLRHEFLPTSVLGGFGAVAAACRLKGLTVNQTVDAMGIFYAHASGNRQALFDRTLTKRIQPAIAARAGIFASCLAERGINGPERVIEGESGLMMTYGKIQTSGTVLPKPVEPGKKWEIERLCFKRFASCGASHQSIQATLNLANKYDLKIDNIKKIEIFDSSPYNNMVGVPWNPNHNIPEVLAQFCTPYEVASAIKNRRFGPSEIDKVNVRDDKEISDLAEHVQLKKLNDYEGECPQGDLVHIVRITTKSDQVYVASSDINDVLGEDLFTEADLIEKFKENLAYSKLYTHQMTDYFIDAIKHIEQFDHMNEFISKFLVTNTLN